VIRERLRRGLLAALEDAGDGSRDERDWQALTEENETLRERNGELEKEQDAHEAELEELKAKHEVEISTLRAEVAHLGHLRESEKDARAEAKRTYEEVVKLRELHHCEPDSMRGALMSIVEACNRHLPRELFNDYKSPLISAAREIRNLATRGLQNDPVFMRDEKARQEAEKPIELDEGPEARTWVEVEINGKTYGSVNLSRLASIEAARAAFDEKFGYVVGTKRVVKFVYVSGKIISVATSPWNLTVRPEAGSCVPGSDPGTTEPAAPVEFEPEDSDENRGH